MADNEKSKLPPSPPQPPQPPKKPEPRWAFDHDDVTKNKK